ncbi:MAG TPA: glycosyltransferase family A protein [Saprospiraceae bacterium]|nr:glycosyltransferase family A protein [Saprospiraceae bacterium]
MGFKIDVIIPAYKAQKTILRTLSSIACQSILEDIDVTIVNDACPNGDYQEFVKMFSPYMSIKEITMSTNGGPGLARQYGIDHTANPYFTCIDADDTFAGAMALETLLTGITMAPNIQCCVGTFIEEHPGLHFIPHTEDMVWMFGKLYKRSFINKYHIHFNETRANEDTGFNTWVRLLCSNEAEQVQWINDVVYYWHDKPDSITRINNCQYSFDQSFCGWTDNMIYAIKEAKKVQPFNGYIDQFTLECMISLYTYYLQTVANNPVFAEQDWEYVKKFYVECYKRIEPIITDEMFAQSYSFKMQAENSRGTMLGFIPCMGIREFMDSLHVETYDPQHIYDIWAKLPEDLKENNIQCGVVGAGWYQKPTN